MPPAPRSPSSRAARTPISPPGKRPARTPCAISSSARRDYKVPQKWELSQQNELLESLVTQGYNAFLIFPGDPVGSVSTAGELAGTGAPVIALAGCLKDPNKAAFCFGTDTGNSAYLGTKELIKAMGPGKKRIAHFTGFLVDPNTQLRIDAVGQGGQGGRRGGRAGHRRHRRARARRGEDQRLSRRPRQRGRRHRHHRLGARRRGLQLPAQDRRQAHQDGRHRPRPGGAQGHQGRLRRRHHAAEPLWPGLYRRLRRRQAAGAAAR